jgi:hypothetical protein
MKKRLAFTLLLSVAGTVVLLVGAGMAGGACHCMTPMFTLFPYGSFVMTRLSWDSLGLLLAVLQFPFYTLIMTVVNGERWKVIVLMLIITLHVFAAIVCAG